jgi:hypothetical protein
MPIQWMSTLFCCGTLLRSVVAALLFRRRLYCSFSPLKNTAKTPHLVTLKYSLNLSRLIVVQFGLEKEPGSKIRGAICASPSLKLLANLIAPLEVDGFPTSGERPLVAILRSN